ncbi:MAG TPA: hypothetical protein VFL12_05255 [Thermoanaerobaculia bacterium]|nr:hypothetical protein [Thermoanaerobaculia bacterium]
MLARTADAVFVSTDRGMSWRTLPSIGSSPINDLMSAGGRMFAATSDGIYAFHDLRVIGVPPVEAGAVRVSSSETSSRPPF